MSKPKYPFEKRLEVVNHYFTTDDGYRIISARFGVSELKYAVTEYIEYYNSRRISLKLKGLTPIEYRNQTYMPRV
ncbi:hypothetical protein ETE47_20630 [Escherichia coli]|nr:hypothetical protein ETE47_20630 [Escherichia coli]